MLPLVSASIPSAPPLSLPSVSRQYVPMRYLFGFGQDIPVALSDESPSGLIWEKKYRNKKPGDVAGCYDKTHDRYILIYKDWRVAAHRVVYYLRTGVDPLGADVVYAGPEKDNRRELVLTTEWQPKNPKKQRKSPDSFPFPSDI